MGIIEIKEGEYVTLLDEWINFLTKHEQLFYEVIGGKFRLLVVDPDLEILFFRDYDSNINIDLAEGKSLPPDSTSAIALEEKRIIRRTVPQEVFGVEIETHTFPFADGSGCLNIVYNVETSAAIKDAINQIVESTEEISSTSTSSVEQAEQLEKQLQRLSKSVHVVTEQTKKLTTIYEAVSEIAKRLQLISLNATIEAAHASKYGQGFAVVAKEVRTLADQTAAQMGEVSTIIKKVEEDATYIANEMEVFEQYSEEQRHSEQEIASSIQTVVQSIYKLQTQTEELMQLKDDD